MYFRKHVYTCLMYQSTLMLALLISTVSTGQLQSSLLLCLELQGKEWVHFPAEAALTEAASVPWLVAEGRLGAEAANSYRWDWLMTLKG